MPFVEDKDDQLLEREFRALPEFEGESPSNMDLALATFRTENSIGSLISRSSFSNLPDRIVNNIEYNPWDSMTDSEKLDEEFMENALLADSEDELEAVRLLSAKERKDRKTISEGGAMSFAMGFGIGGLADPINLIPIGGTAYKTYKTGKSILHAGMATGSVAATSTAIQEAALHATQIERTYGESAINMSAAFLLGGALGMGAKKLGSLGANQKTFDEITDSMDVERKVRDGDDSVGAARVLEDVEIKGGKFVKRFIKAIGFDPLSRTLSSVNPVTRKISNFLAENPIEMDGGITTAVESLAKIHDGKYAKAIEAHLDQYRLYKKNGGKISKTEFNQLVSRSVRSGEFDIPEVGNAAKSWDSHLYEPMKKRMIEEGLLPEDVDVKTANNYLNRIWNKQKVAAQLPEFIRKTSKWLEEEDFKLFTKGEAIQKELAGIEKSIETIKKAEKQKASSVSKLTKIEAEQEKLLSQKQKIVARAFEKGEAFKTATKGRKKGLQGERRELGVQEAALTKKLNDLDRRISAEKVKLSDIEIRIKSEGPIAKSDRFEELKKISEKSEFKKGLGLEKQDYDDVARQISQRIRGTPDGKLPYDWKLGDGSANFKTAGTKLRGPLNKRVFNIPDHIMEEFLENDIERLGARYLRQIAADTELSRAFDGDVEMKNALKEINDEWSKIILGESDPKKRVKLEALKDRDIADVAAMRDRIRGVFGQVDHNNPWVRTGRVVRDLNYLRFMGGVVASSVPDVARIFMAEGFANTFRHGLRPLVTNMKKFKVSASEAKRYGVGVDALMGGRSEIIADVADYTQGGTAFERLTRKSAEKFGKINLMDFWTGGVKQLHAVTMQTSVINDLMKGKYDKRLGRLGISEADAKNMTKEIKKHGKKTDGIWLSGAKNWDNPALEEMWGTALRKESDRVIVIPGQEKPLFMSTELGKSVFQFRSFMFSATQRMLIAGVQGQESNFVGGTLMITSLGMMAYAFKQWDAGRELSDDPRVWITEGIDRSGSLGSIMEINNTLEKISNNNFGLRPLIGARSPSSRFASRSQLEGLLGPTFGSFAGTSLKVLSAGTQDREWDEKDTRTLRRLLPYQNLMLFRQVLDQIEKGIQ